MVGFSALIGSHVDYKKLPESEDDYLPLEQAKERKSANKQILEEMRRERAEILKNLNK